MKKEYIIIDVDDVILDTLSVVVFYFNKITKSCYLKEEIITWDFKKWPWVENKLISIDEFIWGFKEILKGYIPLKYYAKKSLFILSHSFNIILLTQRKEDTYAPLKDNLQNFYNINYPLYNAVWHKEGKKFFVEEFIKTNKLAYFIDDGPHNLESVSSIEKREFKVVKFNMPYNKDIKADISIDGWLDFYKVLRI